MTNETHRMMTNFLGGLPLILGEKIATVFAVTDNTAALNLSKSIDGRA